MVRSSLSIALISSFTLAILGFVYFDVAMGGIGLPSGGPSLVAMPYFDSDSATRTEDPGVQTAELTSGIEDAAVSPQSENVEPEADAQTAAPVEDSMTETAETEIADPDRESLGPSYAKDFERVYYKGELIPDADAWSFEILVDAEGDSEGFPLSVARDQRFLWYGAVPIIPITPEADIRLFSAEKGDDPNFYFADGQNVYVYTSKGLIRALKPAGLDARFAFSRIYCTTGIFTWNFKTLDGTDTLTLTLPNQETNNYCE